MDLRCWIHDHCWILDPDIFLPSTREKPWIHVSHGPVHDGADIRGFICGSGCHRLFYGQDPSTSWTRHRRLAWTLLHLQRLHMYNLQLHCSLCSTDICGVRPVGFERIGLVLRCLYFRYHAARGPRCLVGSRQRDGKHGSDLWRLPLSIRRRPKGMISSLQQSHQLTSFQVSQRIRRHQRHVRVRHYNLRSLTLLAEESPSREQCRAT